MNEIWKDITGYEGLYQVSNYGRVRSLHFHLARHFYSMYLLNKKVPITSVSKAIGHSNISITQHYAKALESTVIDDIIKVI